MNGQNENEKLNLSINKTLNLNNTIEIIEDNEIKINYLFYILGMIIIIISYFGPFFYYKIIMKKNFNPQRSTGIKHVI